MSAPAFQSQPLTPGAQCPPNSIEVSDLCISSKLAPADGRRDMS